MKRLLFVILLTIMGCCGVHVQAVGYEKIINPVLPGDRPDPTVIEINGEYWAAATSNEWSPLFPIFKSKDLVNWELVNYVFPDGAPDWALNNFWAPELSYDEKQGKVYLYYTARDKRTKRLSCAAAVADSPMGRFKDLGPLVAQEPGSIDAFAARETLSYMERRRQQYGLAYKYLGTGDDGGPHPSDRRNDFLVL